MSVRCWGAGRGSRIVRDFDAGDFCGRVGNAQVARVVRVVEAGQHIELRRYELRIDWSARAHRIDELELALTVGLSYETVERPDVRGRSRRRSRRRSEDPFLRENRELR